jgi:uncharacterized damage-inducible protein DinB
MTPVAVEAGAQGEFMKTMSMMAATGLLMCAVVLIASAQGRGGAPAAPTITTLAGDVQADWAVERELFLNIAEAMPDDKFGYKPTPAQRSFGEQIMHVVQADTLVLRMLGGKTPAPPVNVKATSKTDVMTALRQSFEFGEAVLREFSDQQLSERVTPPPYMGPSASRLRVIYSSMQHTQDIYGQMVVYLRLNGIVPPASRRGGL